MIECRHVCISCCNWAFCFAFQHRTVEIAVHSVGEWETFVTTISARRVGQKISRGPIQSPTFETPVVGSRNSMGWRWTRIHTRFIPGRSENVKDSLTGAASGFQDWGSFFPLPPLGLTPLPPPPPKSPDLQETRGSSWSTLGVRTPDPLASAAHASQLPIFGIDGRIGSRKSAGCMAYLERPTS
jgi:hypothetical protein